MQGWLKSNRMIFISEKLVKAVEDRGFDCHKVAYQCWQFYCRGLGIYTNGLSFGGICTWKTRLELAARDRRINGVLAAPKSAGELYNLSPSHQGGRSYDAAGNLMHYLSTTYMYDQENRLSSTAGTSRTYDGNGERVLKSSSSTGGQ
jgi:hypothetical protein